MKECKNCSASYESKYCPNCGNTVAKRIDNHYVWHEIQHSVIHFDKGFGYTILQLLHKPGHAIRAYVLGKRANLYKPVGFVFITSVIYLFVRHLIHFTEPASFKLPVDSYTGKMMTWVTENYNYANLIEILFIAGLLKLLFRDKKFNFFEYLVLLCYLIGMSMLLVLIAMLAAHYSNQISIYIYSLLVVSVYCIWGIGQFFGDKNFSTYILATVAYAGGLFLFIIGVLLVGGALDSLL